MASAVGRGSSEPRLQALLLLRCSPAATAAASGGPGGCAARGTREACRVAIVGLDRDTFMLDDAEAQQELLAMAEDLGVCATLGADAEAMQRCVCAVQAQMRPNPYHNFRHVFDVAQFLHNLLRESGLAGPKPGPALAPMDVAALWCAALFHDLGHPGHSLNLEVAIEGNLFESYEAARLAGEAVPDTFTIEWAHGCLAQKLLDEAGLLQGLARAEAQSFKALVSDLILATDLAQHKALNDAFREVVCRLSAETTPEAGCDAWASQADRLKAMRWLLKSADIANTTRSGACALCWDDGAFEEFHEEGDMLLARGLVSPRELPAMLDRQRPGAR
eukprot:CAMPEP_0180506728 /NCGR_PEP_ID=MMETSP1036_2-20121128/48151_1 /TAXON_ID=632150 /ORGANISM="Azadinium spinosum, Strain 3D9" /LENGTH=332 /DNA_ID=CAMNT_0022516703 /DNA_START=33 /DNA_END=1027 /DNA_ORIENTATION=+